VHGAGLIARGTLTLAVEAGLTTKEVMNCDNIDRVTVEGHLPGVCAGKVERKAAAARGGVACSI